MSEQLKAGDIVQLKSGGPEMTILELTLDGKEFVCRWFDKSEPRTDTFPPESLEKV